ncbi:MAG: molecular chaperone GrpE [Candidatus Tokpelaia sp. JSC161]|jgi:molecular chaperone GrpE|nr:MAG: molecular chaperone GrpE [Candidatus Tokpelaia sp. JSC161]
MFSENNIDENTLNQQALKDDVSRKEENKLTREESLSDENPDVSSCSLEQLVETLEAEKSELKDQVMRLAADMENLRRRTARDIADAKSYSIASFARDMLSISDNLARALSSLSEKSDDNHTGFKALVEGLEMTERAITVIFRRYGIEKIEAYGQQFNPHFHQAMFEVSDMSVPSNTIKEVVQVGYTIGDRVLRPAMVGVSKSKSQTPIVED